MLSNRAGWISAANVSSSCSNGPWIWWAATTVTTVGYGDLKVETDGGRIIAMAIMLVGIGFVALLTAFIADRFIQSQEETEAKEDEILDELREIRVMLEQLESTGSRNLAKSGA